MNVTAKHGQAAVHLASREINNAGHYASACGISATANSRFTVRGYKDVQKLRPTDKAVTCKRCLKVIERDHAKAQAEQASEKAPLMSPDASPTAKALAEASAKRDRAMREAYEAEGTPGQAYADKAYEYADDAYHAAKVAHQNARIAYGDDVKPIAPRPARKSHPVGRKLAQDHGLNFF